MRPECKKFHAVFVTNWQAWNMSTVVMLLRMFLLIRSVSVHSLTDPTLPDIFFPLGTDVGDKIVPVEDEGSSPEINIATGFPFFDVIMNVVYVSTVWYLLYCVLHNDTISGAGLVGYMACWPWSKKVADLTRIVLKVYLGSVCNWPHMSTQSAHPFVGK